MGRALLCLSALCLSVSLAQPLSAQDNSASPTAAQTPSSEQPAPKKVWTNDDVSDLRADSPISSVGSPKGKPANSGHVSSVASGPRDAKWYHDQIARLENQIPPLDAKIAQLQAAIDGKFAGDGKESTGSVYRKFGDWSAELQDLKKKRDDIATRANALRDQARRAGIPANALP